MPMGSIFPNKKFRTNYIKGRGLQLFLARRRGAFTIFSSVEGGGLMIYTAKLRFPGVSLFNYHYMVPKVNKIL